MEPIAALSLASNVIQVVNFSASIVSKSSELYTSYNGRLVQHTDIATTSSDLSRLTTKLSDSITPPSVSTVLSEDELALRTLCKGAIDVSRELQDGLKKLQVNGAPSKRKSLRKALKSIWSKDHITELQSRLALYRDELDSRILVGIKSNLDLVELRQSEGFDKLDDALKASVQSLLESSTSVELKIEQRAAVTDAAIEAKVDLAQNNIVKAVEVAGKIQREQSQSVDAQLSVLQVSGEQILTAGRESRDEIVASIASSTAVSSEEHEQMEEKLTKQWKSAEEQIAGLREELKQIKNMIAESARKASTSKAKTGDAQQKKLIEQTNMLYKILVAKDIMLQSLLDLVEAIKSRLHNYTRVITSVNWKVDPYDSAKFAAQWSIRLGYDSRVSGPEVKLFKAIEVGSLSIMPEHKDLRKVVNVSKTINITLADLDPQTALFYSTMVNSTPNATAAESNWPAKKNQLARKMTQSHVTPRPVDEFAAPQQHEQSAGASDEPATSGPASEPIPNLIDSRRSSSYDLDQGTSPTSRSAGRSSGSFAETTSPDSSVDHSAYTSATKVPLEFKAVGIEMTALTWTLFALRCHRTETRCTILDVLIDAGANRQARDPTGLCAYDHARILKLDRGTVERLNPFVNARTNVSSGLLEAIRNGDSNAALKCLNQKVWPEVLDQMHQSPLALAIHKFFPEVIAKLVELGFSPFASYATENSYFPSMAYAFLRRGLEGKEDSRTSFAYSPYEWSGSDKVIAKSFQAWVHARSSIIPSWSVTQWTKKAIDLYCDAAAVHLHCTAEVCPVDITSYSWGDVLVLGALLNKEECLHLCLSRPNILTTTPADGAAWALYATIRLGNNTMVEKLAKHSSKVIRKMIARPLDQRHFLAAWWPWPCACKDTVHTLGSRSLLDYVQDLGMASLCPSCEKLEYQYMTIGFNLKPYYDCYDDNGEFIRVDPPAHELDMQPSLSSSSFTRSIDSTTDKDTERQIYEMPGDVPPVKEREGKELSTQEAIANRGKMYNGVE